MKDKKKLIILSSIILGVLVLTLGITYAAFTYNKTGETSKLVLGDIWMKYTENNQLTLSDAMPTSIYNYTTYEVNPVMASQSVEENELYSCVSLFNEFNVQYDEGTTAESFCKGTGTIDGGITFQEYLDGWISWAKDEITIEEGFLNGGGQELLDTGVVLSRIENLPYFEFTIGGKNTYTKEDIWYDIVLTHGDEHNERTTRIRDDLLKFTLVKVEEENEIILFNNRSYKDLNNKRIWVETISANTTSEVNNKYRLYMWIDEDTVIGNVNQDYTMKEWEDVFASVKVSVTGDFVEKIMPTHESCFEVGTVDNNGETEIAILDYNASCGNKVIIPESMYGYKVGVIGSYNTDIIERLNSKKNNSSLNDLNFKNDINNSIKPMLSVRQAAFISKGIISVVIPNTVRIIENSAFEGNQLTSIVIPNSVTTIGSYAFNYNQLKTVVFGTGIQYIGFDIFEKTSTSNPDLESITFTSKTCDEIKNIQRSSTDTTKYFPWLYSDSPYYQTGYKADIIGTDGVCNY